MTSAGTARERSRSACSQSKHELARSVTVCTRALTTDSKSAYGFSAATRLASPADSAVAAASLASRSFTSLPAST